MRPSPLYRPVTRHRGSLESPPPHGAQSTAADLIAWTQTILLDGAMAKAEPKLLRYRLLHTAARIVHRGRRTVIKIAASWPWAEDLAAAFTRLAGIRQPLLA